MGRPGVGGGLGYPPPTRVISLLIHNNLLTARLQKREQVLLVVALLEKILGDLAKDRKVRTLFVLH